jgi:hypothetical protein
MRRPHLWLLLVGLLVLQGCATFVVEQETTEGPTAEEIWKHRFALANRRAPGFEEKLTFQDQLDQRMRQHLARNPEAANSLRVSNLRFWYQVSTGMTKEEVRLLLGAPDEVAVDQARLEVLARKFWPQVKEKAKEAWTYPGGWNLFFDGERLVTLTQYRRQFLQD